MGNGGQTTSDAGAGPQQVTVVSRRCTVARPLRPASAAARADWNECSSVHTRAATSSGQDASHGTATPCSHSH